MIYLGLFIIVLAVFSYYRKKNTREQEFATQQFWDRENLANHTRSKDISELSYITIPFDNFPIDKHENNELNFYEKTLKTLGTQKILRLSKQSNTDLKLAYGIANLDFMIQCDQNYITLCQTLVSYADKLYQLGYVTDAVSVLEYGISIDSDLSKNYLLLATIYHELGENDKIDTLIEKVNQLDSLIRQSTLDKLHAIVES